MRSHQKALRRTKNDQKRAMLRLCRRAVTRRTSLAVVRCFFTMDSTFANLSNDRKFYIRDQWYIHMQRSANNSFSLGIFFFFHKGTRLSWKAAAAARRATVRGRARLFRALRPPLVVNVAVAVAIRCTVSRCLRSGNRTADYVLSKLLQAFPCVLGSTFVRGTFR
jgi:hypothetical protein